MSLIQGLKQGLKQGLIQGLNASIYGSTPVFDANFETPTAQSFPTTASGLAALMNTASPDHIWDLSGDPGASDYAASVGGDDLSQVGTNGTHYRRGAPAYGLPDASGNLDTETAWEAIGVNNNNGALVGSAGNVDTSGSWALMLVYRVADSLSTDTLVSISNSNPRIELEFASGGTVRCFRVDAVPVSVNSAFLFSSTHDGVWRCVVVTYNATTDELQVHTDEGSGTAVSTATQGTVDPGATSPIRVGYGGAAAYQTPAFQARYMAWWSGTEAEKISGLHDFWTAHQDPTGLLTTNTRTGVMHAYAGSGEKLAAWADDVPVIEYSQARGKFGIRCAASITNLMPDSWEIDQWATGSAPTVTRYDAEAPSGMHTACEVAGSVSGSYVQDTAVGTATSTEYTFSAWVRADTPHDMDVSIRHSTGEIAGANAVWSVTSSWQRFSLTFTSDGTDATVRPRIYPGENGVATGTIHMWGAQLNVGGYAKPHVMTQGASASMNGTSNILGVNFAPTIEGTINLDLTTDFDAHPGVSRNVFGISDGASVNGLLRLIHNSAAGGRFQCQLYDEANAIIYTNLNVSGVAPTSGGLIQFNWRVESDLPYSAGQGADLRLNMGSSDNVEDGTETGRTIGVDNYDQVVLGDNRTSTNPHDGCIIHSIEYYDQVQEALAL